MFNVCIGTYRPDGCIVVELRGELDIAGAPDTLDLLMDATELERVTIVDLAALDFIDCTGLRALTGARTYAHEAGHVLALAAPGERVRKVLKLTGSGRLFPVHASVAAAAAVHGRPRSGPAVVPPLAS
ncbi:MAG: STAS domain-containing protein [Actinomycetota bacterium]